MLDSPFKTIGLIVKHGDPGVAHTLQSLSEFLRRQDREVLLDERCVDDLPGHGLEVVTREQLGERSDLAIVIGGDGSLLNAARSLADAEVALLGINRGRLGFLADVLPDEMHARMTDILEGRYIAEERLLLHARVHSDNQPAVRASDALNDVVVHKWDVARMIELETWIDGHFVNCQRSDGLIVSTPTGSTAYALSGGGPIVHPALDTIGLVPICPHTLSYRPLIVHADSAIDIVVGNGGHSKAQITCDGQINLGLASGDRVEIRRKPRKIRLIHPAGHDYFNILRVKLEWGGSRGHVPRKLR